MMEITIDSQGRLAIPAKFRKALSLKKQDKLILRQEGTKLILEREDDIINRIQAGFANLKPGVSLVDELRKERHWEFEQEQKWLEQ